MEEQAYDIAFCGFGVGACLLLRELDRRRLLDGRSICIFEPDVKLINDKTLCFWGEPDSAIVQENADLITRSWDKAQIPPFEKQSLSPFQYHQIDNLTLYEQVREMLKKHNVEMVQAEVDSLRRADQLVAITTSKNEFYSHLVYDSRPPRPKEKTSPILLQSFLGQRIQLPEPSFDPNAFSLMDFAVPQGEHTQFVYILPEDSRTALVEFTRFGLQRVEHNYARRCILEYMTKTYGSYTVLDEEHGVIPMTTQSFCEETLPGVVDLGTRSGAVKPSTGYAFETMFEQAKYICDRQLRQGGTVKRKRRFVFYDRLLIDILESTPALGKPIFMQLFKHQSVPDVLRFLHERTSLWQEASIFANLTWAPFLKAAAKDLWKSFQSIWHNYALILMTLFYLVGHEFSTSIANGVVVSLLAFGLAFIGIPHGAVDHKVLGKQGLSAKNPIFLGSYLGIMALMGGLWALYPLAALLFFLVYSAWHFGQTDFEYWKIENSGLSFCWGGALLLAIIGTHLPEVVPLLASIGVDASVMTERMGWVVAATGLFGSTLCAIAVRSASWLRSIALITICLWTPLVIGFGIYFIGQHSWIAWQELQKDRIEQQSPLWIESLPFTLGAFALFCIGLWFSIDTVQVAGAVIILGSCISLPHVLCMDHFYRRRWLKQQQ